MTTTPYSHQWLATTWARMQALDVGSLELDIATGLLGTWHASFLDDEPVTLELVGPIDEWLDQLEQAREAQVIDECVVIHPGPKKREVAVRRVDVRLDALTNLGACATGEEHLRAGRITLG